MRHTARAIILQNKKLLLLTGHGAGYYWTPGGGIKRGETAAEALHREIKEELGVQIADSSRYYSYTINTQRITTFIVTLAGDITLGNEITGSIWYSPSDDIRVSQALRQVMIPRLIQEGRL